MTEEILATLNKHWQKFFKKFEEIDTLKVSQWKEVHMLAYICKRYEQLYSRSYAIAIKGAPSKCVDLYQTKSIYAMLGTTNPVIIKQYIDWVFETKLSTKRSFQRIGFFLTAGFGNEFQTFRAKAEAITRSTLIPRQYKEIADQLGVHADTYGDLAFILMAIESRNDKASDNYIFLSNLEAMGLNINQLRELK